MLGEGGRGGSPSREGKAGAILPLPDLELVDIVLEVRGPTKLSNRDDRVCVWSR